MKSYILLAAAGTTCLASLPAPAAAEAFSGFVSGFPSRAAACNGARSAARTDAVGIGHEVVSYSTCECSQNSSGAWACETVAYTEPRAVRTTPPRYRPPSASPRPYTPPRPVNPVITPPDIYRPGNG